MVAGHLQIKNGTYYIVLGYFGSDGKRKSKWITTKLPVKGNKKRAEQMLMEARKSFIPPEISPKDLSSGEMLLTDYLKMWIEIAKSTIKITTYGSYSAMLNGVIIPYFDPLELRLSEVQPHHIQKFYLQELERVSANSVIHYHAVLHRALKYAVKTDLIPVNPVDKVDRPKKAPFQGSFYSEEELQKLFQAVKGTKIELPVMLTAFYGLRRSEVLGLKWNAIDFEKNTITIKHTFTQCEIDGKRIVVASDTTKNKSSRRTLPLIPQFKDLLLEQKTKQREYQRVCGKSYNRDYLGYICVDPLGNIIKPDYLTQAFPKLLKKNGLRHIRLHDLRHTCASLLLKNGVPMKQIQEWLGHSDFGTTANIYAHLDYNSKLSSANAMLAGMSGALEAAARS